MLIGTASNVYNSGDHQCYLMYMEFQLLVQRELTHSALNVLSPFLAGFMIPGKPIGVMVFKVFSTIALGQA